MYFLPLILAAPAVLAMVFVLNRIWPTAHKLVSILIKLVVRA